MRASMRLRSVACLFLGYCLTVASAHATTFPVTKIADTADGNCNADCSLREAIIAANANAGPDDITLPAGFYLLTIGGTGEDAAAAGDLDITGELTINGAGEGTSVIDGGDLDRVVHILGGPVTFNLLTIQNGTTLTGTGTNGAGGGIFINAATNVSLNGVAVELNTVGPGTSGTGGGIYNQGGTLSLTNSTIRGNVAGDQGGGIFNVGPLQITNSTISGNTNQDQGAGIFNLNNDLFIINSTISGNIGNDNGGGIYNNPLPATPNNVTIIGSTIADNSSGTQQGGGIYNLSPGVVNLNGTILANNTGGNAPDCAGTISSLLGYNLIENTQNCTISGDTTGNKTGQDPQLQPLGDNGGPTQTRSLGSSSPAIDMWLVGCAGSQTFSIRPRSAAGALTDQRGVPRPQGAACDMGAFECQPMECAGGVAPTPTPTPTVPAPTPTFTPTTPVTGVPPTVPTLSFPMLALLAIALAGAAMFLMRGQR